MLFSSQVFLLIFLPVSIILYYLVKNKARNYFLLLVSLIFYAWGGLNYIFIIINIILITYLGSLILEKLNGKLKISVLALTLICDLSFLFYYKYFDFVIENLNTLCGTDFTLHHIILPLGISFYTFQALSYVIDVYRGEVKAENNLFTLALYIMLFPQLIAGPIVKYHDISSQLRERHSNFNDVAEGLRRFILGLSKKVLVANPLGEISDRIFAQSPETLPCQIAWLGAVAYSLQLYFDFSGYADMALGLGRMFGFRFKENFNYPYISGTISEFWRRWHMSLSGWFKDYLYIPLGGSCKGENRTLLNLFIVFLVTGIWHGAAWNFVAWGLWHGFFVMAEHSLGLNKRQDGSAIRDAFFHLYTLLVVMLGWVMFRADSMSYAFGFFKTMAGFSGGDPLYKTPYFVDVLPLFTLVVGVIFSCPVYRYLQEFTQAGFIRKMLYQVFLVGLALLCLAELASSSFNPFIYFRF